ncbi:MAG: hypothetical protein AAB400_05355 [Patescibacteria group bacterium]
MGIETTMGGAFRKALGLDVDTPSEEVTEVARQRILFKEVGHQLAEIREQRGEVLPTDIFHFPPNVQEVIEYHDVIIEPVIGMDKPAGRIFFIKRKEGSEDKPFDPSYLEDYKEGILGTDGVLRFDDDGPEGVPYDNAQRLAANLAVLQAYRVMAAIPEQGNTGLPGDQEGESATQNTQPTNVPGIRKPFTEHREEQTEQSGTSSTHVSHSQQDIWRFISHERRFRGLPERVNVSIALTIDPRTGETLQPGRYFVASNASEEQKRLNTAMEVNVNALQRIATLIRERYQAVLDQGGVTKLPYAEAQRVQLAIYHDLSDEGIIESILKNASRQN